MCPTRWHNGVWFIIVLTVTVYYLLAIIVYHFQSFQTAPGVSDTSVPPTERRYHSPGPPGPLLRTGAMSSEAPRVSTSLITGVHSSQHPSVTEAQAVQASDTSAQMVERRYQKCQERPGNSRGVERSRHCCMPLLCSEAHREAHTAK